MSGPRATLGRRTVYYSGRVQGVGFRYTSHRIAGGFAVTGTVRNLPDGRVELIAEGTASEIEAFLAAIRQEMGSNIESIETVDAASTGEFRSFEVRR